MHEPLLPRDAQLREEPRNQKPCGIALHNALTLVKCPLAFNPKPWLLKLEILGHGAVGSCSTRAEANVQDHPSPSSFSASVPHYSDHPIAE